jgi:hypothetical protein
MLYNKSFQRLIARIPVSERISARSLAAKTSLVFIRSESGHLALSRDGKIQRPPPRDTYFRDEDRDVDWTELNLSKLSQSEYTSAAFSAIWKIANSTRMRRNFCALVSILDSELVSEVKEALFELEADCRISFMRGDGDKYFDSIERAIGGIAIVSIADVRTHRSFADFAKAINALRHAGVRGMR